LEVGFDLVVPGNAEEGAEHGVPAPLAHEVAARLAISEHVLLAALQADLHQHTVRRLADAARGLAPRLLPQLVGAQRLEAALLAPQLVGQSPSFRHGLPSLPAPGAAQPRAGAIRVCPTRPMRSRTSRIVSAAIARHRAAPSPRISHTRSGRARYSAARARMGSNSRAIPSASSRLHSTHPSPAERQPRSISARRSSEVKNRCSAKTLHTSGRPGSLRRTRCGSVTAVRTRCAICSGESSIPTVLPRDLLIFASPSSPRIRPASPTSPCGSGKYSPNWRFHRR